MDIFGALSQAGDVSKPGVRDRLPAGAVVLVAAVILVSGALEGHPDLMHVGRIAGSLNSTSFLLVVLALLAATILLEPLLSSIDGFLLGSWHSRGLGTLARGGRIKHQRRCRKMENAFISAQHDAEVAEQAGRSGEASESWLRVVHLRGVLDRTYPRDVTKPTLLGNILDASERRAGGRYGLDTLVTAPRLEPLLPPATALLLSNSRDDLRFAVRMASALGISAFLACVVLWPSSYYAISNDLFHEASWLVLLPLFLALLSWSSYRTATTAAVRYGEALAVMYDLHRFSLYAALHLETPVDTVRERKLGQAVSELLTLGREVTTYESPEAQGSMP